MSSIKNLNLCNASADDTLNRNLKAEIWKVVQTYDEQFAGNSYDKPDVFEKFSSEVATILSNFYAYDVAAIKDIIKKVWFRSSVKSFEDDLIFVLECAKRLNKNS